MDRIGLVCMRLRANPRQCEVATRLGIHPSVICDLERGRRPITPEIEERITRAIHEAGSAEAK